MSAEFLTPEEFTPYQPDRDPTRSPYMVVKQTDFLVKAYFKGNLEDLSPLADYIKGYTLPFLAQAVGALPMIQHLAADMTTQNYEEIKDFITKAGVPTSMAEGIEAFDFSSIVFGNIPDNYQSPIYPQGLSRRGMAKPPVTVGEFASRLGELHEVTGQIAEGKIKKSPRSTYRKKLVLTEAYYDTGAQMLPPSVGQKSKIEIVHETSNRLLEGIELDLSDL